MDRHERDLSLGTSFLGQVADCQNDGAAAAIFDLMGGDLQTAIGDAMRARLGRAVGDQHQWRAVRSFEPILRAASDQLRGGRAQERGQSRIGLDDTAVLQNRDALACRPGEATQVGQQPVDHGGGDHGQDDQRHGDDHRA